MTDISSVDQLHSVQLVTNVHTVAQDLPVGARLNQFWTTWAALGASSKVIRILMTLPLWNRKKLRPDIPGFLFLPKTHQVKTYPGAELTEQLSKNREIQNGDTRK